jgi:putative ABC transport system ATP-binding protein
MDTSITTAASLQNISKSFGDGSARVQVLRDISVDVRRGEMFFLVGPSGCGKTTLLSILCGTLKPDTGSVTVLDTTLTGISARKLTSFRRQHIGFVFQQFNLIPTLTITENVSVPLLINGVRPGKANKLAAEALDRLGLGEKIKLRPNKLSGGQQQRVAIARALVHSPDIIVCDEPTSALDSETGHRIMEILDDVARDPKRSVIVVTHDPRIVSFADRIAEMEDGRILTISENKAASETPK